MARKLVLFPPEERRQMSPIWLTVYSDMMTNLMLFFLMMWGLTRLEVQSREQMLRGLQDSFRGREEAFLERRVEKVLQKVKEEDTAERMQSLVKESELEKYAKIEISEQQMKMTLIVPVLFDLGQANLKDEVLPALKEVVNVLKPLPNDVVVEGHTDNLPITGGAYKSNWELSIARAVSVIDYFVSQGVPAERFIAAGYGEYHPVAPNDTPENRAKNRRIEINIIRRRSL